VNRAEARRRLVDSTCFQFVGDKVLVRDVALIEALSRAMNDRVDAAANHEQDVALDSTLVLAA